jgi:orotidine-5'-phosphate decarboxylase
VVGAPASEAELRAEARARLCFALDHPSLAAALASAAAVRDHVGVAKVGLELFCRAGPDAVRAVRDATGLDVFVDVKLHDIPATVGAAVRAIAGLGARLLTVHAAGGEAMLRAAVEAAGAGGVRVVAVTVLTSLDAADLAAVGVAPAVGEQSLRLAELAWGAGVRALVCSPLEVAALRARFGAEAFFVTPGVRPRSLGSAGADQKRVATPAQAVERGADLLVVGRPIRDAAEPAAAAAAVVAEIAEGLRARAQAT